MRKKKSLTSTDAPIPNSVDPVATDYSPENNRCIKCNKVGKMLVCSEVGPSKPSTHLRGSHPPILVKKEVTNVHPPSRKRLMWTADEEQMLKPTN